MNKNIVIALLIGIITFMGYRVSYLENQRYALLLSMCNPVPDFKCLDNVDTRYFPGNLLYGLFSETY